MMKAFNIYCDESCHLENDHQQVMVLGALSCPEVLTRSIARNIKALKAKHGLKPSFEVKWTKVAPGKLDFYLELLDYFFAENGLHFRALVVSDKTKLCHKNFNHDHDTWYYKMYFELIKVLLDPKDRYRIYLDIKDTKSGEKVAKLHEVLSNNSRDFDRRVIERIQNVRSHEIEQVQIADLLIGCVLAANKSDPISFAKRALVEKMGDTLECCLNSSTPFWQKKCNIFCWSGKEVEHAE